MCCEQNGAIPAGAGPSRRAFFVAAAAGTLVAAGAGLSYPAGAQDAPKLKPIPQPPRPGPDAFMARAKAMRALAVRSGDQGYGAVIVRNGVIVGQAPSRVVVNEDPTAHAEMEAIRDACRRLGSRDLSGCVMYGTSRACPMCETGAYWAGLDSLYYGSAVRRVGKPRYRRC